MLVEVKEGQPEALEAALSRLVRLEALRDDFPAFLERELVWLKALWHLDLILGIAVVDYSISMNLAALYTRRLCLC